MAIHFDAGVYAVEPVEHAFTNSSNGNPMIEVQARPVARVYQAGMDGEYSDAVDNERVIYLRFVIPQGGEQKAEQTRAITMKKLRLAGWKGNDFSTFKLTERFLCNCDHGEYNNKPSEQWDVYMPPRSSEHKPELASFMNTIMDKMLKSETIAAAAQPQWKNVEQPAAGDDVPF